MADDTPSSGEAAGEPRRRRPPAPTIELTATEIGAAEAESQPAAQEANAESADAAAEAGQAHDNPAPEPDGASPPPPDDAPSTPISRNCSWRSLAAGAAGALLVVVLAGGLWAVFGNKGDSEMPDQLARLESQLRDLSSRPAPVAADPRAVDDLAARLEQARAADPAIGNRLAAVESSAKATADRVADLNRRGDESAKALREMRDRLEAEARSVSELSRQASASPDAADRADLDALGRRVAALEAAAKSLRDSLEAANKSLKDSLKDEIAKATAGPERGVRLALASVALKSAVEAGRPYAAELGAVRPLLADGKVTDALQPLAATGLPTVDGLAREFSGLAPKMLGTIKTAGGDSGFLERLQANAERLVRIRPISDAQGDDPAAVIARMEARAAQGDLAAALVDMAKLPPDTRAPAETWAKKVAARLAALDATQKLTADALAGLGRAASQGGQQK